MTVVEFIMQKSVEQEGVLTAEDYIEAKEMHREEILLFAQEYDEYVFKGGSATMEEYYDDIFKN